ncbi:hypothetical protein Tcan_16879 [Toxocara canis]|uniref:Uncharacterized protein n=1 Tax=Toxocara canis TaxID=6265 RepID=A0A0B2UZ17_TOXCA|nr:hypothetical protein Tcan_16879 [Toxocara canis]
MEDSGTLCKMIAGTPLCGSVRIKTLELPVESNPKSTRKNDQQDESARSRNLSVSIDGSGKSTGEATPSSRNLAARDDNDARLKRLEEKLEKLIAALEEQNILIY